MSTFYVGAPPPLRLYQSSIKALLRLYCVPVKQVSTFYVGAPPLRLRHLQTIPLRVVEGAPSRLANTGVADVNTGVATGGVRLCGGVGTRVVDRLPNADSIKALLRLY